MPAGPYALHNDQHAYSAYGYGGEKSPSAAAAAAYCVKTELDDW